MSAAKSEKIISYILAMLLLFLGIRVELGRVDTSVLYPQKENYTTEIMIRSANHVEEETICTLNMLSNGNEVLRSNMLSSVVRNQYRAVFSFLIVGVFLQYLFYYQSAESKEDGQLFLCRTVVVDYIHLKDSGE